jgi:hypothetical protein
VLPRCTRTRIRFSWITGYVGEDREANLGL